MLGGEEVEELSCFPPPAAGGWAVIPARGQCPQEQESSWLSSGMAPIRCGWHHPALTHTLKPPSWTLPRSGASWDVGTVGRSQHSPARATGLSWRVPALGCAFRCCGQVLALCIPQEPQGTAPQSSQCWTRSSDRTFVSLELLDSGQKQREGSARRKLLENEAYKPWEGAPGEGDTPGRVFIKALIKTTIQISLWGWTGMAPGVATLPRGPFAPRALPQQHSHPQKPPHTETPQCPSQRDPTWHHFNVADQGGGESFD